MKYMIIEKLNQTKIKDLYNKFEKEGRLLPDGVKYIDSWIDEKVETCYQIMESESLEKIIQWTKNWKGYAEFKIIPVITSKEAKEKTLKD